MEELFLRGGDDLELCDGPEETAYRYIGCEIGWFEKLSAARYKSDIVLGMLVYRLCAIRGTTTVDVTNGSLKKFGISRWTKYRTLRRLAAEGVIRIHPTKNKLALRVTILGAPVLEKRVRSLRRPI
jgi:hypothetical protein